MTEGPIARRPPPLPPNLPRRTAPPPAPPPPAGGRPFPAEPARVWVPLPEPRLMHDRPPPPEAFGNLLEDPPDPLLRNNAAWIALIGWAFVLMILLLIVMPTEAIPKLVGPFRQPVSAAGYGPVVALFAILAVIVAFSGILWMWVAMGRDYRPPGDQGTP
jgi:hypothetical protein